MYLHCFKNVYRLLAALFLLCLSQAALAYCIMPGSWQTFDLSMNVGKVVVDPSSPVGAILAPATHLHTPQMGKFAECRGSAEFDGVVVAPGAQLVSGAGIPSNTYSTNIAGIGIRMARIFNGSTHYYNFQETAYTGNGAYYLADSNFTVELIKIANTTGSGSLAAGTYTKFYIPDAPARAVFTTSVIGQAITIVSPSCTVEGDSKNITVDFGSVPAKSFSGVGSTAAAKNFDINLSCQQSPGEVYVRFDAVADPSNAPGVLQITQGTQAAGGVGIQLLDARNGNPVSLGGQGVNVGNSPNGSNTLTLPMQARYYQTGSKVTAGQANGTATFTVQYQ